MILFKIIKKYFIRFVTLAAFTMLLAMPLAALQLYYPHKLHSLSVILHDYSYFFTFLRWLLIVTFVLVWPKAVRSYAYKQSWSEDKADFWMQQRIKLTVWFVLFELLVCENIPLALIKLLWGT